MGRVRKSWRRLKCTHMQGQWSSFSERHLCLSASFSSVKFFYIIFWMPIQSLWSHVLPMQCTRTSFLSSMQLPWHFCGGNTCGLFTLGNRCTSCCFSASSVQLFKHATHAIIAEFLLGHLHPGYFRKQVYFLLCHPRNIHGM